MNPILSLFSGQLWKDNQPAPLLISLGIFPDDNHLFISAREQVFPSYFYYNQPVMCHFAAEVLKKKSFSGWIDTSISLVSCFRIQYYVEIMKDVVVNKEPQMLLIYLIIMLIPLQNFLSPRTFWIVSMGSLLNKAAIIKSDASYHLNEIRSGVALRCE